MNSLNVVVENEILFPKVLVTTYIVYSICIELHKGPVFINLPNFSTFQEVISQNLEIVIAYCILNIKILNIKTMYYI